MHWADKVAGELLERGRKHVIETGTSISGIPHIGNASDVIRGDAVRKVLKERGAEADFIWVADDSDPFRKVPGGMEKLKGCLGFPVYDIPDPDLCHDNFVEHFVEPFLSDLEQFGVKPKSYSAAELYRKGFLYDLIRTALKKRWKIIEILNKFRDTPLPEEFIPWNPICENCRKISTPKAIEWDERDIVRYVCEDAVLSGGKVKGCGHEGESDIKKGFGKLPWRVEWAARWAKFKVTCEPLGKEHASAGGSFWTSKVICKEIFNWEPPMPVIYEFFTLNGEKISSSKGNVITLGDWLKIAEPEVLKAFMYKVLKKQRDINLERVPNLVDEYDEAEKIYFGLKEGEDKLERLYELSQINTPRYLGVPFTLCAVISQIPNLDLDKIIEKLHSMGYGDFDAVRLGERINAANNWVSEFGPGYLKFELLDDKAFFNAREKLNEKQKQGLRLLADEIELVSEWDDDELAAQLKEFAEIKGKEAREVNLEMLMHKRIYDTARSIDLKPGELFDAVYLVLTGKLKGPKAASFLLTLDKNFVTERFKLL
ncbi:MAG: lysine--tRNA ligase [Candidatus Altiarchaeales archaeon WOR_SM1_86-2]|nr:MAG: lysine--tRNA ligase [Candidatus Altiarchaeales archaeon WOR_SM1_86-2]